MSGAHKTFTKIRLGFAHTWPQSPDNAKTSAMMEGVVNRQFFYLKAIVLAVAIAVAGMSTGFHTDRLAARFDPIHYGAVIQANATLHCASYSIAHGLGKLLGRTESKQVSVLSD
jgi:hypothetical protein